MDTTSLILLIAAILGLVILILGHIFDKGALITTGMILLILGLLVLFAYEFLSFLSTNQFQEPNSGFTT